MPLKEKSKQAWSQGVQAFNHYVSMVKVSIYLCPPSLTDGGEKGGVDCPCYVLDVLHLRCLRLVDSEAPI